MAGKGQPNKPASPNLAVMLWHHVECHRRGVGEPDVAPLKTSTPHFLALAPFAVVAPLRRAVAPRVVISHSGQGLPLVRVAGLVGEALDRPHVTTALAALLLGGRTSRV